MARTLLFALLSCALAGVALAKPIEQQEVLNTPVHTTESWEYSLCGDENDLIKINSIKVSPDPPKPGQDLTVTVNAEALERVEDGAYAQVTVKLGLIKLLSKKFDLCDEAEKANADVQCPIEKGVYEVTQTVALPKEIPQAKFLVNVDAYSKDEDPLTCLNLNVDFRKKWPGFF